ncbi:hypothetical protein [Nitrosomonas communis]|uniref:hypothetical protein n=1 Tax=Nitrosomonas communis TaxID=44574 RepID=UPI00116014F6|nr:hypothetical protein [Nitrosomonas communis]
MAHLHSSPSCKTTIYGGFHRTFSEHCPETTWRRNRQKRHKIARGETGGTGWGKAMPAPKQPNSMRQGSVCAPPAPPPPERGRTNLHIC